MVYLFPVDTINPAPLSAQYCVVSAAQSPRLMLSRKILYRAMNPVAQIKR